MILKLDITFLMPFLEDPPSLVHCLNVNKVELTVLWFQGNI